MANPRDGRLPASPLRTPGPLGRLDGADPDEPVGPAAGSPPTPGPLGVSDTAAPDPPLDPRLEEAVARYTLDEKAVIDRINAFIDEAFRFDEQVAETLAERPEEQASLRRELGLAPSGDVIGPPSKYLARALQLATAARKGHSLDPVLRDAQYYFHTRSRVAATPGALRPFTAMAGGVGAAFWDFAKWALPETVESWIMQKDPNDPNSPPGGWVWGLVGCSDGLLDHIPAKGRPRYAKSTPRHELVQLVQGFGGASRYMAPR